MSRPGEEERWKNIIFKESYKTKSSYQISNYGRVRNMLDDGACHIKKPVYQGGQIVYKFSFPEKLNNGSRKMLRKKASHLVARHFYPRKYLEGCSVVWKDHNHLNNYYKNLQIMSPKEAQEFFRRSKQAFKDTDQVPVLPNQHQQRQPADSKFQKVEAQHNYFKVMREYPNYEINRQGVIRRAVPPFKGKVIKPRLHPSGFLFCDLKYQNKRYTVYPHKEVAKHWNINVMPEKRTIVSHLDGDLTNNDADNLEWTTPEESARLTKLHQKIDYGNIWKVRRKRYGKNGMKKRPKKSNSTK